MPEYRRSFIERATSFYSVVNSPYTYDAVGNVVTILDAKNSNQRQCFTYDNLNRLTKGTTYTDAPKGCTTQLGNGNYDESYSYSPDTGNLSNKTGIGDYNYDPNHKHAVATTGNGWSFEYDDNGNQTNRNIGGAYTLTYDTENHLTAVSGPGVNASFVYDGDGNRVQSDWFGSPDHTIIACIGNTYEYQKVGTTTTVSQYYYAGSTRIAMRQGGTLYWLFGDHLGSTSRAANENGTPLANGEQRYKPWGEKRYPTGASGLPTTPYD